MSAPRDASSSGRGADAAPDAAADDASVPGDAARADAMPAVEDDAGSDDPGPRERTMLVDHTLWALVAPDKGPFRDQGDAQPCRDDQTGTAYGYEDFVGEATFFVNTADCGYLDVAQPSLRAVRAGELIKVRLWHFPLTAPEESEAHVAVQLGDAMLFEDHVPIPSSSELLTARWTAEADIAAGEPVLLHLHNHGANEYLLIEVSAGPPD